MKLFSPDRRCKTAISVLFAVVLITTTQSETAQSQPTSTPRASADTLQIHKRTIRANYRGYGFNVEYPEITNERAFNDAVLKAVTSRIQSSKEGADFYFATDRTERMHGGVGATYSATVTTEGVVSVLLNFNMDEWSAVHPWGELVSINYDLCAHRVLRLSDFFRPASPYLSTLSKISIRSLESEQYADRSMIRSGASPTAKNYSVFTVSDSFMTIYFQQYQVAAGAAGSTSVDIPLSQLKQVLRKPYGSGSVRCAAPH